MYYNTLNGRNISALGMGGLRLPLKQGSRNEVDMAAAEKLIAAVFEEGINYFDTGWIYLSGNSERALGELLSAYPRDSFLLADKYYAPSGLGVEEMFETQLERCRVDYFDYYLIHSIDEGGCLPVYMDPEKDVLGYLRKQKEKGRIRNLGFSSHASLKNLQKWLEFDDDFDMAMIQLNYIDWTLLDAKQQYEMLTDHGIPVWVMEPQKGGMLSVLNPTAEEVLKSAEPDRSLASWGFRFLMTLPNVYTVLSGMSTIEQVRDNAGTFKVRDPLSEEEKSLLEEARRLFFDERTIPCTKCRYCTHFCPQEIDIPVLIQKYNEEIIGGEVWKMATQLSEVKDASACIGCGTCEKHCPQGLKITEVMRALQEMP